MVGNSDYFFFFRRTNWQFWGPRSALNIMIHVANESASTSGCAGDIRGGEFRCFHLYSRLSRHFDITLLSPTYSHHQRELVTHSPTFREHRIPKAPFEDELYRAVGQEGLAEEFSALICTLASRHPNAYHQAYCELQVAA